MDITFIKSGRGKAQCPPDPAYPNGIALRPEAKPGTELCHINLPYPAPECGMWSVTCDRCQMNVLITAAGRPDDPISVLLPCNMEGKYAKTQ